MGLLDELKQQADSLRQKQQVTQEEINQNLLVTHAKLTEALHYWVELFNSLNVIKPTVLRYYHLDAQNKMENLRQCDYGVNGRRLTLEHKEYIEAIMLRFHCTADQKLTIEKQTDPLVQRMREYLWAHNLKFDVKELRNERGYVERGIFTVPNDVPVVITIYGDLEKAQVNIATKNLEKFGEFIYTYDFDEFTKEVHEELAKIIIAKPSSFRTMGRYQQVTRATTPRAPRVEADPDAVPPEAAPQDSPSADGDPGKSFFGNIKSILKR